MNDFDLQFEHDLRLLKNSITPSRDLLRRVADLTKQRSYKFLLPAATAMVLVIAVVGFRNRGQQDFSGDTMINILVNDARSEQSIANESSADVALVDSDRAQMDAFAGTYNANEY